MTARYQIDAHSTAERSERRRRCGQHFAIDLKRAPSHQLNAEFFTTAAGCSGAILGPQIRIVEQAIDRCGEGRRISGRNRDTGHPVERNIGNARFERAY